MHFLLVLDCDTPIGHILGHGITSQAKLKCVQALLEAIASRR